MAKPRKRTFFAGLLISLGLMVLVGWSAVLRYRDTMPGRFEPRLPGMDHSPDAGPRVAVIPSVGEPVAGPGKPSALPGSWPWFRGAELDGIGHDGTTPARSWPAQGPPVLWTVEMGEGYAGAAVRNGKVYVLDYDREHEADVLRCLSLDDGREIWRTSYPVEVKRNHGMSRTVPAVTDKYVVSLGPKCHLSCMDAETGRCLWILDLVGQYGTAVPPWYAGQCPLVVDGNLVVIAPAGPDALVMALDIATGEPVWQSPNPRGWTMTHVSVTPMQFAGRKMYVYCGSGGVAGVSADDGSLLWESTDWKISIATCPSPTILKDGRIFFSGGYNAGALLMQLEQQGDRIAAKTVRRFDAKEFGSTQHTPIFYEDHIYGVRERDKQLVCMKADGTEVWSSGSRNRFGLGPYLIVGGVIYVLSDDGRLTMAAASPDGYHKLGEARILDGHDAWAPMALVEGRLLLRDFTRMVCIDIGAGK